MTGRPQPLTQRDFSGALNAVTNPHLLGDKQCARISNMMLGEHGSLTTRDGYTVSSIGPGGAPVVHRTVLNKVNMSSVPLAVLLQSDGNNILYRTDTSPWTSIGGFGVGIGFTIPHSVTMSDAQVFAAGYTTPWQFDGTTLAQITAGSGQTVPPGAKHLAFHLSSLWLWNTSGSTTTLDGPSSIRMSDANNFNSWPNAQQVFISKDDGQVGMGLATFTIAETGISPTQTLIAFKNYSAYEITGVLSSPTTFSVQKIKSDMGCIAPRTIQFVSGFGLIRLTHKGFALYNGVEDKIISEEIRPFIFGSNDIPPLGFTGGFVERSWAAQNHNPLLYIAACPTTDANLSRVFLYDLVRRAWTICSFPFNLRTLTLFTGSLTEQPITQAGTADTGVDPCRIVNIFSGARTDNGVVVPWSLRTRMFSVGSFMHPTYWRRLVIDGAAASTVNVTAAVTLASYPPITRTLEFPGTPVGVWGSSTWGSFAWGSESLTESRRSLDILTTAVSSNATISGSGHFVLRGLEWQVRTKPLTRQIL